MEEKYRDIINCCMAYKIVPELIKRGAKDTYSAAIGQLENISRVFERYEKAKDCDKKIKTLISGIKAKDANREKILKLEKELSEDINSLRTDLSSSHSLGAVSALQSSLTSGTIIPPK